MDLLETIRSAIIFIPKSRLWKVSSRHGVVADAGTNSEGIARKSGCYVYHAPAPQLDIWHAIERKDICGRSGMQPRPDWSLAISEYTAAAYTKEEAGARP